MKKLILILTLFACTSAFAQHGIINIQTNLDSTKILQYEIDTLESYQVGPGIIYTRFDITANTGVLRHCYIYEVDLTNPYNTVEAEKYLNETITNLTLAENKQEFIDLMQRVKEFKEKWL
jgi:hypothetical protein